MVISKTSPIFPSINNNIRDKIGRKLPPRLWRFVWFCYEILRGRGRYALAMNNPKTPALKPIIARHLISELIKSVPFWWHSIKFGDIVTPGYVPEQVHVWKSIVFPQDLSGKKVLDIGAYDGYYSFEAERRGASLVIAVDINPNNSKGFRIGKKIIGSDVEYLVLDAHDLDSLVLQFDMINWMGNYYHLHDPRQTLSKIYSRLRKGGLLTLEGKVLIDGKRVQKVPPDEEHPHGRYTFSIDEIIALCRKCGFSHVELTSTVGDRALFRIIK